MTDTSAGPAVGRRRLVLLLAGTDAGDLRSVAEEELDRIQTLLVPGGRPGTVSSPPEVNPMAGTASMLARPHYGTAVEVDIPAEVTDDTIADAVRGIATRHAGVLSSHRSAVLVGRNHRLRDRPPQRDPSGPPPLKVMVAVRGTAGWSADDVHRAWLDVGRVNAAEHPTCTAYAQLHADGASTGRAMAASGLSDGPFKGLAVEVFAAPEDLHAGHRWAASPESTAGTALAGADMMTWLGRCLDFGSARCLLAEVPSDIEGRRST